MKKFVAPILLTLVLTACGGGGGGGSPTADTTKALDASLVLRATNTDINLVNTIAVGDLNNDGLEDIVVGGWVNNGTHTARIYVFYQNLNGTLTEKTTEVLPSNTYNGSQRIFIADFDQDGRNDIVLPGFDDGDPQPLANTVIFWNNSGMFVRQDLNDQVQAHGACYNDIDRDGDLDMLISGANGGLYINQGNRNFDILKTALPVDFWSTCSVIHNHNHTVSILLGNSSQLAGYKSTILTFDYNMNLLSTAGIVSPVNNGFKFDLVNSLVVDTNGDGYLDFVAAFNDFEPSTPGAKQVLLGDGQGNFVQQPVFDNLYHNQYYSYLGFIKGHMTLMFGDDHGSSKIYQIVNGNLVLYRQDSVDAIYQNTVSGKVYVLQYVSGKYYTKELL